MTKSASKLCEYIKKKHGVASGRKIIEKLKKFLDDGGDINKTCTQDCPFSADRLMRFCTGTILHASLFYCSDKVTKFILSKGADISIELTPNRRLSANYHMPYRFALEIAAYNFNERIFKKLKKPTLELYSAHGVTSIHVDCALDLDSWSAEALQRLETADFDVDATVSIESPLWPGMTPLLIAAKFGNYRLMARLLDLGADPFACDLKGNNPLHYLSPSNYYDDRLFAFDARNTFSLGNGESHFHVACHFCEYDTLDFVQHYLDQGISPDLRIKRGEDDRSDAGKVGLHIALRAENPELTRLLLEYGADVDKKDLRPYLPMKRENNEFCFFLSDYVEWTKWVSNHEKFLQCVCLFLEAGSIIPEKDDVDEFFNLINYSFDEGKLIFLQCIKKLTTLSEDFVSKELMEAYRDFSELAVKGWNESEFAVSCSTELEALFDLGLRSLLDGSIVVKSDYKSKFEWLDSFDFASRPIYGSLLKMKYKRKLRAFEPKKEKVQRGVAKIRDLFRSLVQLPHLCAETILWNMSGKDLDLFVTQ